MHRDLLEKTVGSSVIGLVSCLVGQLVILIRNDKIKEIEIAAIFYIHVSR